MEGVPRPFDEAITDLSLTMGTNPSPCSASDVTTQPGSTSDIGHRSLLYFLAPLRMSLPPPFASQCRSLPPLAAQRTLSTPTPPYMRRNLALWWTSILLWYHGECHSPLWLSGGHCSPLWCHGEHRSPLWTSLLLLCGDHHSIFMCSFGHCATP